MAAMHGVDEIIRLAGCALPSGIQTAAEKGLTSRRNHGALADADPRLRNLERSWPNFVIFEFETVQVIEIK